MSEVTRYYFNTGGVEYTAQELEAVLKDSDNWEGWDELPYGQHAVVIDGVEHQIEVVSTNDRGSWSYDEWIVFTLEGRFFRVDGHYESYSGGEWGSLREVRKGTKTVEVYE